MSLARSLAREFETEAATTRRFFERFPDEHADFRPHERSMTLSRLASHIADAPLWTVGIVGVDEFDVATSTHKPVACTTRAQLLEAHAAATARVVEVISPVPDEDFAGKWTLRVGERVLGEHRRVEALRTFVLSHLIHHRGQLSVYYRLLSVPVPGAYGPSADDPSPF